jgi:adenosylmethionine-8-amino-7-oxononanoate aminotransferase
LACAHQLERTILEYGPESVAAFIAEPVVGAAAGALVPPAEYFQQIRSICDRYDVLFIADEVFTGFGRLGRWFGIERFGVIPDIIVFAKGIAGGYAALGGFAAASKLLDPFLAGSARFEHNFTYAGHPVAAAAGAAVIRILRRDGLIDRVAGLEPLLFDVLRAELDSLPIVGDIRGMGFLAGVELVADRRTMQTFPPSAGMAARAARYALQESVIVYPCNGGVDGESGDYLLIAPPFITTEEDLTLMAKRVGQALSRLRRDIS